MGRLLPLNAGHTNMPNYKEVEALRRMIEDSGFLKDEKIIPIIT